MGYYGHMTAGMIPITSNTPAALSASTRAYRQASKAKATQDSYRAATAPDYDGDGPNARRQRAIRRYPSWATWCAARGVEPLADDPALIAEHLAALADAGASVATIETRRSAIGWLYRAAGRQDPTKTEDVRAVSAGIRRRIGRGRGSAPILLDDLRRMVGVIDKALGALDEGDGERLRLLRDRALVLIGWSAALRRSELAALRATDIRQRGADLVIHVARSKTDQEGEGADITLPRMDGDPLDAATAWAAWRAAAKLRGASPAWRSITRWGGMRENALQGQDIGDIVQRWARAAGVAGDITAHSLRSGFITQAALSGAGALDIRQVTRHQSDAMLQRYIRSAGTGSRRAVLAAFGRARK